MIEEKDFIATMTSSIDSVSEVRRSILGKWQHNRWQREAAVEAKSNNERWNHHYRRKEDEKALLLFIQMKSLSSFLYI